jgi:phosphomannomutase/phosphoglucomutase
MNPHIFREYDVRGLVATDFTDEVVAKLARALGTFYARHGVERVSVGRDARESSPRFSAMLVEGITSSGIEVVDLGMVPTPVVYFSLFAAGVGGGIMITGSHNPAEYNGFKICLGTSTIFGDTIQEIREIAESGDFASGTGRATERDLLSEYRDRIAASLELGDRRSRVVVDSGNGMGGIAAVPLYRDLGFDVVDLYGEPDSRFPNHHPDPTVLENLDDAIDAVARERADLAIAFDGDGDRIGAIDETGGVLWGDQLMTLFARAILAERPGATVIGEVKCSQTLFDDVAAHGGRPIMWKVGHSLIKAKMKETGAALAGEMSGHIFFADRYFGYDDAIYAGARLLEILSKTDRPLSSLVADLPKTVATPEIRVDCPDEVKLAVVRAVTARYRSTHGVVDLDGARIAFDGGWGLVRSSNTQPIVVLRFEAESPERLEEIRAEVESCVRDEIAARV